MTLTIVNVAYPFAPVGPASVGGAEQMLAHIDAALVAAGHRSIVVARADSQVHGRLAPLPVTRSEIDDARRRALWHATREAVERVVREEPVHVVHLHGVDFPAYLPSRGSAALLATLHLPPSWYPPEAFDAGRGDLFLHCVSQHQLRACPPFTRMLPVIENGVPVDRLASRVRKRRYALAMGRICPEKNWHAALQAGRLAGMPVLLAGEVFPYEAHRRYFEESVRPLLDAQRRFIGPVAFDRKRRLLSGAQCLLLPTLAPETSSLVAMEAIACGTPVVAYPSGALPEIVTHGVTGFLVDSPVAMARAIPACATLDPQHCREIARERFRIERALEHYFDVYRELAATRPVAA